MDILFVVDPLSSFKIYKDTTFAMMREVQRRGHQVWACEPQDIVWQSGQPVTARMQAVHLTGQATPWFEVTREVHQALHTLDAVVMRKDPPFDVEYVTSTWLLEQAQRDGARIFNDPRALRDHSEKLAIAQFSQFTAPTLVARSAFTQLDYSAALLVGTLIGMVVLYLAAPLIVQLRARTWRMVVASLPQVMRPLPSPHSVSSIRMFSTGGLSASRSACGPLLPLSAMLSSRKSAGMPVDADSVARMSFSVIGPG